MLQTCSGINTCTSSCGHILSPSFPAKYDNDIRCTWAIYVTKDSYIQLTFRSFDVYERDSPECVYDKLNIYNENPQDDGSVGNQGDGGKQHHNGTKAAQLE